MQTLKKGEGCESYLEIFCDTLDPIKLQFQKKDCNTKWLDQAKGEISVFKKCVKKTILKIKNECILKSGIWSVFLIAPDNSQTYLTDIRISK